MDEDDLTILPIKEDKSIEPAKRQIHPNLPDLERGSLVLLISPIRTGKSTVIS